MLKTHEEKTLNVLLNAVADRQQILSNNLTNVSTPGFVRQDLDFGSVIKNLNNKEMNEINGESIIENATYEDYSTKPSFEKELAEMAENHIKYLLLVKINGDMYKGLEEATQSGRAA
jgi:flagellar basal body rod protein FlgB